MRQYLDRAHCLLGGTEVNEARSQLFRTLTKEPQRFEARAKDIRVPVVLAHGLQHGLACARGKLSATGCLIPDRAASPSLNDRILRMRQHVRDRCRSSLQLAVYSHLLQSFHGKLPQFLVIAVLL
eukprot:scaffold2801_cov266-Pinguiococcus_pyrenoidosus.AAC.5